MVEQQHRWTGQSSFFGVEQPRVIPCVWEIREEEHESPLSESRLVSVVADVAPEFDLPKARQALGVALIHVRAEVTVRRDN